MKKIRLRTVFIFLLAALSGALLLHASQSMQNAEQELNEISQSVEQEQESLRVLRTEWAYLNNPERLEKLAHEYLGLKAPASQQIATGNLEFTVKNHIASTPEPNAQPVSFSGSGGAIQPAVIKPSSESSPSSSPESKADSKIFPEKDFESLVKQISNGDVQ